LRSARRMFGVPATPPVRAARRRSSSLDRDGR
jgi:hypothetical protein